jgi:RecA/RadA recombinase
MQTERVQVNGRTKRRDDNPLSGLDALREAALVGDRIESVSKEELEWIWRGIVGVDHHTEIAGPPYSGKTTLLFLLAVAMANPTDRDVELFGRSVRRNPPGKFAVIIEEENSGRSGARKLIASCQMLGLPINETLTRIILIARKDVKAIPLLENNETPGIWRDVLLLGERGGVGGLFLDSRSRILGEGDANGEKDQAFAAGVISQALKYCDAPVFIVSHTRKSGAETIEDIAGHHQRAAGADVILLVTAERTNGRIDRSRVVVAKLRDGDDDEHPEPVTFRTTKGDEKWILTCGEEDDDASEPASDRVHKVLMRSGELSARQIRKALGMNAPAFNDAIATLRARRLVKSRQHKIRGIERAVYKAVADWPKPKEETT